MIHKHKRQDLDCWFSWFLFCVNICSMERVGRSSAYQSSHQLNDSMAEKCRITNCLIFFFYCACSFQALLGQSTAHIWFPSLSNILFRLPNCFQDHVSAPISFHMHFTRIACYATNISISNFHFCRANKQTKQGHTTLLSLSHSLYFVILFLLFQCLSATNIKAVLGECTVSAGYRGNGSNREPGREVKVDLKDSQTK